MSQPGITQDDVFAAMLAARSAGVERQGFPNQITQGQDYPAGVYFPATLADEFIIGANTFPLGTIAFLPFYCTAAHTFTGIAFANGSSVNGNKFRMGIYTSVARAPAALLIDSGELTVGDANTNTLRVITISQALKPYTLYWLAVIGNTASNVWNFNGLTTSSTRNLTMEIGSPGGFLGTGYGTIGWQMSQAYGALPATASALSLIDGGTSNAPVILYLKG